VPVLELASDDQYLVATGDTPLLEIWDALPQGLVPPFPPVELPGGLGELVARGGFGQNFFFPSEILGLTYRTPRGRLIRAGGRVIKNVQGYDLVRPFVGSFGLLGTALEVTLRLRPARAQGFFQKRTPLPKELPGVVRFAWQENDTTYVYLVGHPKTFAAFADWAPLEPPLDYRPLFPDGMGVGEGPLRDLRFTWASGGKPPPPPEPFVRTFRDF